MCKSSCSSPAKALARISFGLSLLFVGIVHYMSFSDFQAMVVAGTEPIAGLAMIWAYVLPGLMILGGLLYTFGMFMCAGSWAAGLALGSIPAGMLLKSVLNPEIAPLGDTMPMAINTFVWIIVMVLVTKKCTSVCCRDKNAACCGTCAPTATAMPKATVKDDWSKMDDTAEDDHDMMGDMDDLLSDDTTSASVTTKTTTKKTTAKKPAAKKTTKKTVKKAGKKK